jgi:hypothetical protein
VKTLLFKLFVRLAGLFTTKKDWAKEQVEFNEQRKICQERQKEMDKCVRPKTYPRVKGQCSYTDYFESGENWK